MAEQFRYYDIITDLGLQDHVLNCPTSVERNGNIDDFNESRSLRLLYGLIVPSYMIIMSRYGYAQNTLDIHQVEIFADESHVDTIGRKQAAIFVNNVPNLLAQVKLALVNDHSEDNIDKPLESRHALVALAAIGLLSINPRTIYSEMGNVEEKPNQMYLDSVQQLCDRHPVTSKLFQDNEDLLDGLPNWQLEALIDGKFDDWLGRLETLHINL